jgi:hypothetical protein
MTTDQIRAKTKTITRRIGWLNLKPGEILQAVEKARGLKKGEKMKKLGLIRVVDVRREPLLKLFSSCTSYGGTLGYGEEEMIREGFPGLDPEDFVKFFLKGHDHDYTEEDITRIQFEYL